MGIDSINASLKSCRSGCSYLIIESFYIRQQYLLTDIYKLLQTPVVHKNLSNLIYSRLSGLLTYILLQSSSRTFFVSLKSPESSCRILPCRGHGSDRVPIYLARRPSELNWNTGYRGDFSFRDGSLVINETVSR